MKLDFLQFYLVLHKQTIHRNVISPYNCIRSTLIVCNEPENHKRNSIKEYTNYLTHL